MAEESSRSPTVTCSRHPRGRDGVVLTDFGTSMRDGALQLTRIRHHRGHAGQRRRCELVVVEHDVRTLAAESWVTRFTVDCGVAGGTSMPAPGRAVKDTMSCRDELDSATPTPAPSPKRGCTRRPERLQHPDSVKICAEYAHLGGLQHHRAAVAMPETPCRRSG